MPSCQSARDVGHSVNLSCLLRQIDRSHLGVGKQHLGGGMHKQTGRDSVLLPVPTCQTGSTLGGEKFHELSGPPHIQVLGMQ